MSTTLSLFKSLTAITTTVAAGGATVYVATHVNFTKSVGVDATTTADLPKQEVVDEPKSPQQKEPIKESLEEQKPIIPATKPNYVNDPTFIYLLAEVSNKTDIEEEDLYTDTTKNHVCQMGTSPDSPIDQNCQIFFTGQTGTAAIDLTFTKNEAAIIKSLNDISDDSQVILKLSTVIYNSYKSNTNSPKEPLVLKSTNLKHSFASLKPVFSLNKTHDDTKLATSASNLALVKLTNVAIPSQSPLNINTTTTYGVDINATSLTDCKLYKLPTNFDITRLSTGSLSNISKISNSDDLVTGKYYVLYLWTHNKSSKDLETATIDIKVNDQKIATATFEHLLIGEVDSTSDQSTIFPLPNKVDETIKAIETTKRVSSSSGATVDRYVVTKATWKTSRTDALFTPKENILCRIDKDDGTRYEDNCTVYQLPNDDKATIDFNNYKSNSTLKVSTLDHLTSDKLQLVKMNSGFYEKLIEGNLSIELIQKNKKDQAWNNKYATLSRQFDLIPSGTESISIVKTNLALVRFVKSNLTGTLSYSTHSNNQLYCKTAANLPSSDATVAGKGVDYCHIYKLPTPTSANHLTHKDYKSLTKWDLKQETLLVDDVYVLQYVSSRKSISDFIENQKIYITTINNSSSESMEFDYDQMLFGHISETADQSIIFPRAAKQDSYLVELDTTNKDSWEPIAAETTYRCKLTSSSPVVKHATNNDSSCQLVPFTDLTSPTTVTSLSDIQALKAPSTQSPLDLKTTSKTFFKLFLDPKKFFNLNSEQFNSNTFSVEILSNESNSTKTLGKATIRQKIKPSSSTSSPFFDGKLDMFLVKPTAKEEMPNGTGTCSISNRPNKTFNCTLHSIEGAKSSDLTQITIKEEPISTSTTLQTSSQYFLVKADSPHYKTPWNISATLNFTPSSDSSKKHTFALTKFMTGKLNQPNPELFFLSK